MFDFVARDYYNCDNPLVKILLPKMNFEPSERMEVIRQAYKGLYQLCSEVLFEKYVDFIDVYAGIREDERHGLYRELKEDRETFMLAQYIKDKGIQQGIQQGYRTGKREGLLEVIEFGLKMKFGEPGLRLMPVIRKMNDIGRLENLKETVKATNKLGEITKLLDS